MDFFLFYDENVCCVYLLESPHRVDSNEFIQHTIILQKIEKSSIYYCHSSPNLVLLLTLSGSNYPYIEHIYMVPKMFELLRFDYIMF